MKRIDIEQFLPMTDGWDMTTEQELALLETVGLCLGHFVEQAFRPDKRG
jgi:hypothetical protein